MIRRRSLGMWLAVVAAFILAVLSTVVPQALTARAAPALQLSTRSAAAGDRVTVIGSGFTGNTDLTLNVTFKVAGTKRPGRLSIHTPANGAFAVQIQVPQQAAAKQYRITISNASGQVASAKLSVLPLVILHAGGNSTGDTVVAGHRFFIAGSGFRSGESVHVVVSFPLYSGAVLTIQRTLKANASGELARVIAHAPYGAKIGAFTVSAQRTGGSPTVVAPLSVIYHPSATLSPVPAQPGSTSTVRASGFIPNTTVRLSLSIRLRNGTITTLNKDIVTGAHGEFTAPVVIPTDAVAGSYAVTITSSVGSLRASVHFNTAGGAVIWLQHDQIAPNHYARISGAGFSPNAAVVVSARFPLSTGGARVITTTVKANNGGLFSFNFWVPARAIGGANTVTAREGQTSATLTLHVQAAAATTKVSASPASIHPGGTVTVQGNGYPANDTIIVSLTLRLLGGASATVHVTAHTDANGHFSTAVGVPANAATGGYTVTARSSASGRAATTHVNVATGSRIWLPQTHIKAGNTTRINGAGFTAGSTVTVSATFRLSGGTSQTVTVTTHANNQGSFVTYLRVPNQAVAGTVSLTAHGPQETASVTLQVQTQGVFTVPPPQP